MIDFKRAKELLIPALNMYGFEEKKDKSCKQYRVYSNGNETLILHLNKGRYEHYQNKSDDSDYGDTIQFLLKQNLPSYQRGAKLERRECAILERELSKLGAFNIAMPMSEQHQKPLFYLSKYDVSPIGDHRELPSSPRTLLIKRRLNVDLSHPDFKDAVALLKAEKGFYNLLFLWRNEDGQPVGGQYKYMNGDQCIKKFLANSNRGDALWQTSPQGKKAIFLTEDPLDAIAHRQLFPEKEYAYVCTGGSITAKQAILINKISSDTHLPLIVGCDNDIAGQVTNYKVYDPAAIVKYTKESSSIDIIRNDKSIVVDKTEFTRFVKVALATKGIQVELPQEPYKDWNEYTLPKKKSEMLKIVSDKVAEIIKANCETKMLLHNIDM